MAAPWVAYRIQEAQSFEPHTFRLDSGRARLEMSGEDLGRQLPARVAQRLVDAGYATVEG